MKNIGYNELESNAMEVNVNYMLKPNNTKRKKKKERQ